MSRRTDIHRPSVINPEDYQFVAFEYQKIVSFGDCQDILEQRARIQAHMKRTGGTYSGHEHGGNCHICGAWAIYTILFYHAETNVYIRTGEICADKMDMSYGDYNAFRAAVQNARLAHAGKKKAQVLLEDRGLGRCWSIYEDYMEPCECEGNQYGQHDKACLKVTREESIIFDIVAKLIKYGSATDNQYNFLAKLLTAIDTRAERHARREQERLAAKDCPSGRVTITGKIVSAKSVETDFGVQMKMLVVATDGFKVWGSAPAAFLDDEPLVGRQVQFAATVTPKADDPKFGFFKRPTAR